MNMKLFAAVALLLLTTAVQAIPVPKTSTGRAATTAHAADITGRWRVKFDLSGLGEKNLVFEPQAKGSGTFLLLDAVPEEKPVSTPAGWSETTNDRVNFSAEVELQLNCCREKGTLIFKGKFSSKDTISGKVIFVGTTIDEENFNGFVSTVGSFTASRVLK